MDNLAPKFDVKPPSSHSVKFYPMANAPNASTNTAQFGSAYLALIKLRSQFQQFKRFPLLCKRTKSDISYRRHRVFSQLQINFRKILEWKCYCLAALGSIRNPKLRQSNKIYTHDFILARLIPKSFKRLILIFYKS